MKLKYFISSFVLLFAYILFGIIFYGDHFYMIILTLLSSFFITFYIFKKNILVNLNQVIFIFLPLALLLLVSSIIKLNFSRSLVYLIFLPVFCLIGFYYFKSRNIKYLILALILSFFVNFYLQPNFFYFYHLANSEVEIKNKQFPKFNFKDKYLNNYELPNNKLVILDFWNTSCSVCFSKFPSMNKLYNKYKHNNDVLIIAVNVPLNNEKLNDRIRTFDSLNLNIQSIYTDSRIDIESKLEFNTYPNYIILKNNKIIYQGYFEPLNNSLIFNKFTLENKIEEILH